MRSKSWNMQYYPREKEIYNWLYSRAKNIIKTSRALVFGSYNFWLYVCSNVRGNLLSSLFKTLFPAFFTQRYYEDSNEPPYITHPAEPRATKGVPKLLAPRKARCVTTVASRATSAGRAPLSRTSIW